MIDTSRNMLYHIDNLNTQSQRISTQMASGRAIDKGSEDASLHADLINLDDKLRVTEGLQLQIDKSQALNDSADANIAETKLSLEAIKIDLMKALNDGMDASGKLALATNLKGIRDNMIDRVNIQVDGEYLFTGSVTTKETLVKDDDFKTNGKVEFGGDGFLRKIAVQPGSYRDRGVTAYDVSFYNASTANASDSFTFSDGERIIDENGNEWKFNANRDKLQQYDHNGKLSDPVEEIAVTIPASSSVTIDLGFEDQKSYTVDLGVDANTDANGNYNVVINGKTYGYSASGASATDIYTSLKKSLEDDGFTIGALANNDQFVINSLDSMDISVTDSDATYDISTAVTAKSGDYTVNIDGTDFTVATAGKTTAQVYADMKTAIEADAAGYTVSTSQNNDQFVINHTSDITVTTSNTDTNYNIWASNEDEATSTDAAKQGTYNMSVPSTPEGRLFESKHNYFDDLNVIINALEGYSTKLDGTRGNAIDKSVVRTTVQDGLEKTSKQFDATNVGHGELGGRNKVFEVAKDKLFAQETHYNILIQEWGGADLAKLAMESQSLDMTYQALYSTIAKMNQLSLVNFLK